MATVEKIRIDLIDKINAIDDKRLLEAIDQLVDSTVAESRFTELSPEQKEMLEMSERDIQNGYLISQEAMDKRNLEWLNVR